MPWRPRSAGPFLDPIFGPLGGAAEGPEAGRVGPELDRIILPQAGGDHAAVEVDDAVQLGPLETHLPVSDARSRKGRTVPIRRGPGC